MEAVAEAAWEEVQVKQAVPEMLEATVSMSRVRFPSPSIQVGRSRAAAAAVAAAHTNPERAG